MKSPFWNILLIDDDPDDYVITKALLAESLGKEFNLRWAPTYSDALEAIKSSHIDAILMDYDLGGRTGVDLIHEAQNHGCLAPIILLTGRGSYEVDIEAMEAGAVDYISKGEANPRLLERAIRYAIERKATENALAKARDELEQRVLERTQELSDANDKLERVNANLESAIEQLVKTNAELKSEIEERGKAEAALHEALTALRQSQDRLRTVIQGAPLILWAVDRRGNFIFYEGKGLAGLRHSPDELVGGSIFEQLMTRPDVLGYIQRALQGEEFTAFIESPQGFVLENIYSPSFTEDGEVGGVIGVSMDVTERIKAQERIAYQSRLLENVNDAIIATDENFRLTTWNRAAEAIYGWKAHEVLKREIGPLLNTEPVGLHGSEMQARLKETGAFNGEVMQNHRDGRSLFIETKTIALHNEHGDVYGYVSVNRDITERKRAEAQIRKHAERAEALAEISRILAQAGPDLNAVAETVVQRVAENIGDFSVLFLLSPDGGHLIPAAAYHSLPEPHAFLQEMIAQGIYSLENQGLSARSMAAGEPVLLTDIPQDRALSGLNPFFHEYLDRFGVYSVLIIPLRDGSRVIGTLGVARDTPGAAYTSGDQAFIQNIADRAALAITNAHLFQALDKSEARFRAIFEESALGIKLSDLEGRILDCNPAFQKMSGYSQAELRGRRFTDMTYWEDVPYNSKLFHRLITGSIPGYKVEKRYVRKDGSLVWVSQAVSVVKDNVGVPQFVVAIVENVTERKQMEAELAEVRGRLIESREAERLYLSQEIHDGPMQELYGITYTVDALASEEIGDKPEVKDHLDRMQNELKNTIQALRVICGQLRPPTLAPFGLEKTIYSHAEAFQREHPEIQLDLNLQPDAQALPESVRLALFRIYQQSLANIVRHTEASQVSVRFQFDAEGVLLEVRDNGRGFTVPKRWVDFVRQGHYGLAGEAERAEALGGRLEVESQPGAGTVVRVVAPL